MMRIDKLLSELGICTRTEAKKLMKQGRLTVNGEVRKDPSDKIDPETDNVCLDGEPVIYSEYVYYMLNKPAGVITATEGSEMTVMDLIADQRRGLYPVGRLDKDTEGLLLITNNGPLGHELLSPKKHIDKEYLAELAKPLQEDTADRFREGIILEDSTLCRPAELIAVNEKTCRLIISEGRFHQVKRMFEAVGNEVVYLKRLRMKNLQLDENLMPGEYRELTEAEIQDLLSGTSQD